MIRRYTGRLASALLVCLWLASCPQLVAQQPIKPSKPPAAEPSATKPVVKPAVDPQEKPVKPDEKTTRKPAEVEPAPPPPIADLATLEKKILAAKGITDASIPALDIIAHSNRQEAGKLVQKLLRMKQLPALALLKAMAAREYAWPDVVPAVLVILGNGRTDLVVAADDLVRRVWLKPDSKAGEACLARVDRLLVKPEKDLVPEIRGAIYLTRIQTRVQDIRPLIGLLALDLDRDTRMRVAGALEAITLIRRFGVDHARWQAWADQVVKPDLTREQLLEASRAAEAKESAAFLIQVLKQTVTALTDEEIERLGRFYQGDPEVAVEAAQLTGQLYGAITDEVERRKVQAKVVPLLLALFDHHRESVVLAAVSAVGKFSKPTLDDKELAARVRARLIGLVEAGTPAMQEQAVPALEGYADGEDTATADRVQAALQAAGERSAEYRVALVTTLGAFRMSTSALHFKRLTEEDPVEAVRIAAATTYLQVAPDPAIRVLGRILGEKETPVSLRRRFASELGNVITKHPAVIAPLVKSLAEDDDAKVLIICANGLGYAQGRENAQHAGAALHARLKAGTTGAADPLVAAAVAGALGQLGYAAAVSDLIPLTRLGNTELTTRTEEALVKIAAHDVRQTQMIAVQLLKEGLFAPMVAAYMAVHADAESSKALSELDKEYRDALAVLYVRALMATGDEKNLKTALTEIETIRRTRPDDAGLLLLQARVLHVGGKATAKQTLEFLNGNRPPQKDNKVLLREWNLLGAWAQLRLGNKDAANLFKGIFNGDVEENDPVYWEYLVGHALALTRQQKPENRVQIEELLGKLPKDLFAAKAPAWLKASHAEVAEALAPPAVEPGEEKPATGKPPSKKPLSGKRAGSGGDTTGGAKKKPAARAPGRP